MQFLPFPEINQYRSIIRHVRLQSAYVGQDESGEPVYDHNRPIPTLHFTASTKLHGTNASVVQSGTERWFQSRSRIITPLDDNAGFATWAVAHEDAFDHLFAKFSTTVTIAVYGEYAGQGIQSGVAIAELPKNFYIFAIKLDGEWVSRTVLAETVAGTGLACIEDFETWEIDIDFNEPEIAQNELTKIVESIEAQCPVGHALGVDGVGEGCVIVCTDPDWLKFGSGMWAKIKGQAHSVSKVRTLAAIDIEKVNSVKECVEQIVTENRLRQGLDYLHENGLLIDITNMGAYLKWLASDAIKEELDTIIGSGLEPRDVGKAVTTKGRLFFLNILKELESV